MKSSDIINIFEKLKDENVQSFRKVTKASYEVISRTADLAGRTMNFHYKNTHVYPLELLLVFYVDSNSARLFENGVLKDEFINIPDEEMKKVPFSLNKKENLLAAFWFYDRKAYSTKWTEEVFNNLPDNEMKNKIIAKYQRGDYYEKPIWKQPAISGPIELVSPPQESDNH